jgi:anaerobic magnesium-protoporphyrin IX monomethyl ester cyclase
MQPYPPLGAMYAASYLRDRGYNIHLFDAMLAESEAEWETAIHETAPQFAVLFEDNFNYLSKMCLLRMRRAALSMVRRARAHGCTVIVAGSDATDHPETYVRAGAHFVIRGEGEVTLGELLAALRVQEQASIKTIAGLCYPDSESGEIVRTPGRADMRDLDSIPFPAWDLVDVDRYRNIWLQRHGYFSMNMVTTRGCPYHCNWCAKPIWGQRYNTRSPENVVAEMRWLKSTYGPDHIWFADDIMGLKHQWIHGFADLVESQDARIPFKSLHRVDLLLRHDTIDSLRRAGARTVWVGAESGSQKVLDAMDKGTRVDQIREAARRLKAAGIEVGFFLQFGYPGETREDIEMTLQMIRDCDPDDIGASVSYPLPGTPFYESVRKSLGDKQNWIDSDDLAMMYSGPFSTEFYRQLHRVLHKEFRMRKGWSIVRGAVADRRRPRAAELRRLLAAAYHATTLSLSRRRLNRLASARATSASRSPSASAEISAPGSVSK